MALDLSTIRHNLLQLTPLAEVLDKRDRAKASLDAAGASLDDASLTIAEVMKSSKVDSVRLNAARLVLDANGAFDKEDQGGMVINLHIDGVQINTLLNPERTSNA